MLRPGETLPVEQAGDGEQGVEALQGGPRVGELRETVHRRDGIVVVGHVLGRASHDQRGEDVGGTVQQGRVHVVGEKRLVQATCSGRDMGEVLVHDAVAEAVPEQPRLDFRISATLETLHGVDTPPSFDALGELEDGLLRIGLGVPERDDGVERQLFERTEEQQQLTVAFVTACAEHDDAELRLRTAGGVLRHVTGHGPQLFAREVPCAEFFDEFVGQGQRGLLGEEVAQGSRIEVLEDGFADPVREFDGRLGLNFEPEVVRVDPVGHDVREEGFRAGTFVGQRKTLGRPGAGAVQGAERQGVGQIGGRALTGAQRQGR